jgi:hypothetical protein
MIKEIFDQPQSLRATIGGRVSLEEGSVHIEVVLESGANRWALVTLALA